MTGAGGGTGGSAGARARYRKCGAIGEDIMNPRVTLAVGAVLASAALSGCVSGLTADCTNVFDGRYREQPRHKAMAHGIEDGRCYWSSGHNSAEAAQQRAVANCRAAGNNSCSVVAVDGTYSGLTVEETEEIMEDVVTVMGVVVQTRGARRR